MIGMVVGTNDTIQGFVSYFKDRSFEGRTTFSGDIAIDASGEYSWIDLPVLSNLTNVEIVNGKI